MTATQLFWRGRPTMYRVFDADDRLIYVGQSMTLPDRISEHRSQSWWWRLLADRIAVQVFPTVAAAKAAEKTAIQKESPVFNSMGYGDWRDRPFWSDADHQLYAAWHAEMRQATKTPRRGQSEHIAHATRRRLSLAPVRTDAS